MFQIYIYQCSYTISKVEYHSPVKEKKLRLTTELVKVHRASEQQRQNLNPRQFDF